MAATVKLLTSCQGGYACDCDICLQVTRFGRREAVECKPSGGGEGGGSGATEGGGEGGGGEGGGGDGGDAGGFRNELELGAACVLLWT